MSHTPGPWKTFGLDWRMVVDPADDESVIADVRTNPDDACLIAAAPDLLAALEQAAVEYEGLLREAMKHGQRDLETAWRQRLEQAREAIAKAKGDR